MQLLIMLCFSVVRCAIPLSMPFTCDLTRLPEVENCKRWLAFSQGSSPVVAEEQTGRPGDTADQKTTRAKPAPRPPALQHILASWKSREECIRSLHVTWGIRTLLPRLLVGDGRGHARVTGPDFVETMLRTECWLEAPNRFRVEIAQPGASKSSGTPIPLWHRRTFDGKTITEMSWRDDVAEPPTGRIFKPITTPGNAARPFDALLLLVAFRPFYRGTTCAYPGEFRLVTENAIRDNRHYVKLQRLNEAGGVIENLWVDPTRGDVVVFFEETLGGRRFRTLAFRYEHDPKHGWLPAAWFFPLEGAKRAAATKEAPIVTFTINEKFPPAIFVTKFLSGTTAFDETTNEGYRVAADGSRSELLKFDSPAAFRIHQGLERKADFIIDPQPLREALAFIGKRAGIEIVVDKKGLEAATIDPDMEVSAKVEGLKVRESLDSLLKQCRKPIGYRIRKDVLVVEPLPYAK
jgi:hypothetical protein